MREETEQPVIPHPTSPVAASSEPQHNKNRWMRYFFTENASPDAASMRDLQRRACWIGVALILQALNEAIALIPIYLPVVPLLMSLIGLISFCLITGSLIALWMAFRPALLKSGAEPAIAQKRPRRWQRVIVILLLITSLAGAAEIVASTVMGFFMMPIYRNDGTSIDMNAAILLTQGRDPYVDSNILTVVRRFSILPIWTTPLRQGQFASSASYPTPDQLSSVLAHDLKTGNAPEFESKVSYPALSFLSLLPFVLLKTNNALPLYLICYLLIMFIGWRKLRPEIRPWLLLLSLANVSMLTSVLNGNADMLYILLILLAWLLRDRRWWSALCLGLALATKQPAWLFFPFYAILIWRHNGLKEAIGRLSIAGAIALAINLPFILWNAHAWLAGVLAPVADPMYSSGVGIVALSSTSLLPLLPNLVYTTLEALAMLFCLAWYRRICKSRPEAAMLLAVLPLFFAWRSLPSYFYCAALPLFILQVVRVLPGKPVIVARAGASPALVLNALTSLAPRDTILVNSKRNLQSSARTNERRTQVMTSKKSQQPFVPQGDDAHLQHLLEQRHSIADSVRGSNSRIQAETALASITSNAEGTQLALLKAMAKQKDIDAADVLLAIHELAPDKAVRKEARRALIQLAGSKVYPSWTPEPERPVAPVSTYLPRFWKGVAPIMREVGEIELVLCWEQGFEYGEARMMSFMLDFWQNGVRDFHTEVGTKRHIESHINDLGAAMSSAVGKEVSMTDCTLAEGRRLILDALMVNKLRKTPLHKDYRHHLPTIQQLVFDAEGADEDRGRTFIDPTLEPDEVASHAVGSWSLGDFGLFYDLLTEDSSIREGLTREEWMERRYTWTGEARPARLEVTVIREREHNQSALWLPGSFLSDRSASRRDVEVCWSLELTETPLGGTLLEMPMGTAVLRETGRHWYWTNYTLTQQDGAWRIQRVTDEGASAQGLPLADIQKRLKEHNDAIQQIVQTKKPSDPDGQESYEEIIWRSVHAMHYLDALLIKMPLDFDNYADATGRATSIGLNERAMVYLEQWERRFPQDYRHSAILQQLGAVESALAAQYDEAGLQERSRRFFSLAETCLQEALEKEKSPLAYVLLGEVKAQLGAYDEAQSLFEAALQANPEREVEAEIENDLANLAVERERYEEALRHFLRVIELAPRHEHSWFNVARTYRLLKNGAEAEVYYQRAIEEEPQYSPAFSELGSIYLQRGEPQKAYAIVEQGVRLHPGSAHMRGLLAGILLDMGDLRRSQAVLDEAERIDPTSEMVQTVRKVLETTKK